MKWLCAVCSDVPASNYQLCSNSEIFILFKLKEFQELALGVRWLLSRSESSESKSGTKFN